MRIITALHKKISDINSDIVVYYLFVLQQDRDIDLLPGISDCDTDNVTLYLVSTRRYLNKCTLSFRLQSE